MITPARIALILLYTTIFSLGSAPAQSRIQFREGDWQKLTSCSKCAACGDQASDKLETFKSLEFFCGEESLGKWFVIKVMLRDCGYQYYRTLHSGDFNIGDASFRIQEDALSDIYREVRALCPRGAELSRLESPYTEYSLDVVQRFFKDHAFLFEPETDQFFKKLDDIPRFPGCEETTDEVERYRCAYRKLKTYLFSRITYPTAAVDRGIQGTVIIQILIDEEGRVKDPLVVQSLGYGTDEECMRAIAAMIREDIRWTPGKQDGKPVTTRYNLPFDFVLE